MRVTFCSEYLEGRHRCGRPGRRWKDGININLKEIRFTPYFLKDWMHLTQDKVHGWVLVNKVTNLRIP